VLTPNSDSLTFENSIVAKSRVAMGGINAVDFMPFGGTYEGTVVKNNHLIAESAMIKVGIAIGGMVGSHLLVLAGLTLTRICSLGYL
jgi:hypothetical protein